MDNSRHAILIGINDYKNDPLKLSSKDVLLMKAALTEYCRFRTDQIYPIISTEEMPIEDVYSEFGKKLEELRQTYKIGDTILFYFSGHGSFDGESFLDIHDKKVAVQHFYEKINYLQPGKQIYIIDACHSGHGVEIKGGKDMLAEYYNERFEAKVDGLFLLCSSKDDEKSVGLPSLGNGVYTWNLVQGMNVASLYDQDLGSLSLTDLHTYASKRMLIDHNQTQSPFILAQYSGYFPFAFFEEPNTFSLTEFVLTLTDADDGMKILDAHQLNFPKEFKRDFSQFLSELVDNLFTHNRSTKIDLSIHNNIIEIIDHSRQSFDPFTAFTTVDGNGIIMYKLFMKKYADSLVTKYTSGFPNIIRLEFSESIFEKSTVDPCYIHIDRPYVNKISQLNGLIFDPACKEITIDMTGPALQLSFMVRYMLDYLIKHTLEHQLIVLKMDTKDLMRESLQYNLDQNPAYSRIMLVH